MHGSTRVRATIVFLVAGVTATACGHKKNEQSAAGSVAAPATPQPSAVPGPPYGSPVAGTPAAPVETAAAKPKHHSKMKGAAAGAVVGHVVGHPAVGAAAGAIIQHERNKHKQ